MIAILRPISHPITDRIKSVAHELRDRLAFQGYNPKRDRVTLASQEVLEGFQVLKYKIERDIKSDYTDPNISPHKVHGVKNQRLGLE